MATKHIRLRVRDGRIEPVEAVRLVEGTELDAIMVEPEGKPAKPPVLELDTWDLGIMGPLSRADIYEDVV